MVSCLRGYDGHHCRFQSDLPHKFKTATHGEGPGQGETKDGDYMMATCNLKDGDYMVAFGDDRIRATLTSSGKKVDDWLTLIQRIHRRRLDELVVGLDIEWRPSTTRGVPRGPVAVLQICVGRRCLVFQILRADYIPASLYDFISDDRFVFFGVGIGDDAIKLRAEYDLMVRLPIDLRSYAAEKLRKPELGSAGLTRVVQEVMGVRMEKPRTVQMSAWDARQLSREQVKYACADAFASFEVGRRLYNDE